MLQLKSMLFSKSAKQNVPGWLTSQPVAHRGLHDGNATIAENSISSFSRAIDAKLPIEFDIHLSADYQPVVFHDANLERMTGDPRQLSDLDASELQTLKLAGGSDTIPLLSTALATVNGQVPLVIEIKASTVGRAQLIKHVWDVLKNYTGPYSIQSFDPLILSTVRRLAPHVIRGQLAMKSPPSHLAMHKRLMIRHMLLNRLSKPHYIGYDVADIARPSVKRAIKSGMALLAWTVDDKDSLKIARQHADNIIFEKLPLKLVRQSSLQKSE